MNYNKIAPFCINIVGMSNKEVEELIDVCIEAGAAEHDGYAYWSENNHYPHFGVDFANDTMFYTNTYSYAEDSNGEDVTICKNKEEVYKHLNIPLPTDTELSVTPSESQNKSIKEEANTVAPLPCLNGVKIDLRDADGNVDSVLSAKFQLACFEQGIVWYGTKDTGVRHLDKPFLHVDEEGLCQATGVAYFQELPNKEIIFTPDNIQFTIADVTPPKETININGVDYYKEDVDKMLSGVTPAVGG